MDSQQPGSLILVIIGDMDSMKQGFLLHVFPEALEESGLELTRSGNKAL